MTSILVAVSAKPYWLNISHMSHTPTSCTVYAPMDGRDLLASTPTGLGKTGFLFMLMLVVRDISALQMRLWHSRR